MGCNVSRLETEGKAKVRPVYRRRFDEFLRHSYSRSHHMSKKNLLKDADESQSHTHSEGSSVKSIKSVEKGDKDEKLVALPALEEVLMIESEEEEEDNIDIVDRGALICPGSPSFRVYCIESSCDKLEEEKEEGGTNKKSETEDINVSHDEESCRKVKKAKRGRKFKRVMMIPKGKIYLLVKSCYIPVCGGGQGNASLINAKIDS